MKYFRNLRAAVKQRYNEAVDYKEYEDQIRNMVDKYIGADEVKQIVKPVNIFEVSSLEDELDDIEGSAAKADFIASRVKKTCTEKMEEDPVLYQKLSEVIDEAIKAYLEKRMSEEEYSRRCSRFGTTPKNKDRPKFLPSCAVTLKLRLTSGCYRRVSSKLLSDPCKSLRQTLTMPLVK